MRDVKRWGSRPDEPRESCYGPSIFMQRPFAFAAILALLGVAGAELAACGGSNAATAPPPDGGLDAGAPAPLRDSSVPVVVPDAAVVSCTLNNGGATDPVSLCLQKSIVLAERKVFSPTRGVASSWSSDTGKPDTDDGGVPLHDVRDDVAFGATLALYSINAREYGDTEISPLVSADLAQLAALLQAELATLPPSYDGRLYLRLRRIAQGLRGFNDAATGDKIDAIADLYGQAIYSAYFHPLSPSAGTDAGADGGDDGGGTLDAGDAGGPADAGDGSAPFTPLGDGILGVPGSSGIVYDVDQAASGALALVDLASRHQAADAANAHLYARAAGSVWNHLSARARHATGLYYTDLETSSDPDHDALASIVQPSDVLLTETQGSVAASLLRGRAIVQIKGIPELASFAFDGQVGSLLNAVQGGTPSLWDPHPTDATTAACKVLPAPIPPCGGGFFARILSGTTGLDTSTKTPRGNGLLFAAIHRALISPGTVAKIDIQPLRALFTATAIPNASFVSLTFNPGGYLPAYAAIPGTPPAVPASIDFLPGVRSYSAQATADAIEALTEQWVGQAGAPSEYY